MKQKASGRKSKYFLSVAIVGSVYIFSLVFVIIMRYKDYTIAMSNSLYAEVNKITKSYQLHQIVASLFLFSLGYLIIAIVLPEFSDISKMVLAMPTAIAVWGILSVIVLLLRIPYTKQVMFLLIGILAIILIYIHRKSLIFKNILQFVTKFIVMASLANIFSTGIVRYTLTSDTHYCIYIYGRLIAKAGALNAEITGDLIETTGIMPALMSSFAVFAGFETLQVIHFLLMSGFIVSLVLYLYYIANEYLERKCKSFIVVGTVVSLAAAPLFLMIILILSHSWMMAYILICSVCMRECINNTTDKFLRKRIIYFTAFLLAWMSLCRVEAIIPVIYMIVCFSYLGITKKELGILSILSLTLTVLFHLEMQLLIWKTDKKLPYGSVFVTGKVLAVMCLAVLLLAAYIIFYETKWMITLKKHLPVFLIVGLLAIIFILCICDIDRTVNNFHSVFYNLEYERWYYFPHLVLFLLIIILKNKKTYGYWDMLTLGMILLSFAMCMGRIQYLRDGWGDSFNRYLLYLTPLILIYLTKEVSVLFFYNSRNDHDWKKENV